MTIIYKINIILYLVWLQSINRAHKLVRKAFTEVTGPRSREEIKRIQLKGTYTMDSVFRQIHLLGKAYNLHGNCSAHNYTFMACMHQLKFRCVCTKTVLRGWQIINESFFKGFIRWAYFIFYCSRREWPPPKMQDCMIPVKAERWDL